MTSRNGLLRIVLLSVVATHLTAGTVRAANEIFVESKTLTTSQPGVQVGVFVINDVAITAIVLPLELREITPGCYVTTNFAFGLNPSGRVYNSPLGPPWPEPPAVITGRYPTPGGVACTGPVSNTYETKAPQINFVSPDGVLYAAVSMATLPPISMAIGNDLPVPALPVTADASFLFTFDVTVTAAGGSFVIDTCCVRPANRLTFIPEGPYLAASPFITPSFTAGVITICACPCAGDPQCDGVIADVLDVVQAVAVAFRGQTPVTDPICPRERTDLDCNGVTDVLDVVHAVAVAFRGGNPATEFCDPCL